LRNIYFPLADRPDPLRVPEIIIVICVLLLWCGSILVFIRHSDILRIRHRDLPYRSTLMKPPMNLNHITVVHRTSDMVIHSKPRPSAATGLQPSRYNRTSDEYKTIETLSASNPYLYRARRHTQSIDSTNSIPKSPRHNGQLLDPYMISYDVRMNLLDLHRKSMENLSAIRHSLSYSTNDVSTRQQNDDQHLALEERCIQESPV
jgi:hypothetical protein